MIDVVSVAPYEYGCRSCGRKTSRMLVVEDAQRAEDIPLCGDCIATLADRIRPKIDPSHRGGGKVARRHPDTSRRAAASVRAGTQQAALLAIIAAEGDDGVTSFHAAPRLSRLVGHPVSANQTATRMLELRERDLVVEARNANGSEKLRRTTPGNEGKVWVMTDAGWREAVRLKVVLDV